jgi:hypothetical protein
VVHVQVLIKQLEVEKNDSDAWWWFLREHAMPMFQLTVWLHLKN